MICILQILAVSSGVMMTDVTMYIENFQVYQMYMLINIIHMQKGSLTKSVHILQVLVIVSDSRAL